MTLRFCSRDANTRGFNREDVGGRDEVCDAGCGELPSARVPEAEDGALALGST